MLPVRAGSYDYNGDGWQDLLVCTVLRGLCLFRNDAGSGFTDVTDATGLGRANDGEGTSFTQTPIPEASQGSGNVVYPIDHDLNGLTDFIVLNGEREANIGPVQLISFFPTT